MPAVDAESALVGAALLDGSVADMVAVRAEHFAGRDYGDAWGAILSLRADREPVDPLMVADRMPGETLAWLTRLSGDAPSVRHAQAYADRVMAAYRTRRAQAIGVKLAETGDLDEAHAAIVEAQTAGKRRTTCTVRDVLPLVVDSLEAEQGRAVRTGFLDIDKMLGGLHQTDLIVIGARPSQGKTAWVVNLIRNVAESGLAVGFASGEQGREQIVQRLVAAQGRVSLMRMRNRQLEDEDWSRITAAMAVLKGARVWIDDQPRPSVQTITAAARAWKYRDGLDLLCVDYLQIVKAPGADKRLQVGEAAASMKALARELDIPVVLLSQVKREVEGRPMKDKLGRMPWAADLSESGEIEQHADQIMTLYRPHVYDRDLSEGEAYMNVAKNRHGPTGLIPLTWRPRSLRFENAAVAAA